MSLLFYYIFANVYFLKMDLTSKLKLKQDLPLLLVNAPQHLQEFFVAYEPQTTHTAIAQAVCFTEWSQDIVANIPGIIKRLQNDSLLWIMYPKKSGSIATDLTRDNGWDIVFNLGYEPVTSVAVDKDWTALRFKKKEKIGGYIRAIPMEERVVEGINFKTRTVILPPDALDAIKEYPGMGDFFNAMSFSHKKEYVTAIVEAKKPETRVSRIAKMVVMLQQKMDAKSKK